MSSTIVNQILSEILSANRSFSTTHQLVHHCKSIHQRVRHLAHLLLTRCCFRHCSTCLCLCLCSCFCPCFRKNTSFTMFQELGASSKTRDRSWKHLVISIFFACGSCIISFTMESGPLTLFWGHLRSCLQYQVNRSLQPQFRLLFFVLLQPLGSQD